MRGSIGDGAEVGSVPRSILDGLEQGCQLIGRDYRYLYVNEAVAAQGRQPREALLGRRMMDVYPGIERQPFFAVLERSMISRTVERFETEFTYPDGSTGWFELTLQPVPEGVFILSLDRSAAKRAEARTALLGAMQRGVAAVAQLVVQERCTPRLLIGWCAELVASGGFTSATIELVDGVSVGAGVPPPDARVLAAPLTGSGRTRGRVRLTVAPLADGDPDVRALFDDLVRGLALALEAVEAMEQRDRAMAELGESEARYRTLVESLDQTVFLADASGALLYASGAISRLGLSASEVVGKKLVDLVDPEDRARAEQGLHEALAGVISPFEVQRRDPDGRLRALRISARPLERGLGGARIAGVITDLTRERAIEEQLRLGQKMEAIGRLAGGIAHDFNNLLTVIIGSVELAVEDTDPAASCRQDLETALDASQRAAALTRQLLAFSRRQVPSPIVLDLNETVSTMERILARLIGEDVHLSTKLDPSLWRVHADPAQLEQVLMNLIVNARDAMPEGGALVIETSNLALGAERDGVLLSVRPGDYVMLSVTDTGVGIDEQTRLHMFEPFFTTKAAGRGTGLGLATVYGIVKQAGGAIWVDSELGRGTTFHVCLPRDHRQGDSAALAPEVGAHGAGELVLVVEDEQTVRRLACRILAAAGYEVLPAASGAEALQQLAARGPEVELLLTDLVMPGMSGRELAERAVAISPSLRVLYMSGHAEGAASRQLLGGEVNMIGKPFTSTGLVAKVREALAVRPSPAAAAHRAHPHAEPPFATGAA